MRYDHVQEVNFFESYQWRFFVEQGSVIKCDCEKLDYCAYDAISEHYTQFSSSRIGMNAIVSGKLGLLELEVDFDQIWNFQVICVLNSNSLVYYEVKICFDYFLCRNFDAVIFKLRIIAFIAVQKIRWILVWRFRLKWIIKKQETSLILNSHINKTWLRFAVGNSVSRFCLSSQLHKFRYAVCEVCWIH